MYPPAKTLYFIGDDEVTKAEWESADEATRKTKRVTDWESARMTVEYIVDGKTVTRQEFLSYLTPSEQRADDDAPTCFTVKADNLIRLCESAPK